MHTNSVNEWKKIQVDAPVFDLHIHPAMNRLVIRQNLNVRHIVSRSFNPFAVRASWPEMKTDFDGFTTPPEDLKDTSEMPRLTQRLLAEGCTPETIRKILGENALRVVRDGWGKK